MFLSGRSFPTSGLMPAAKHVKHVKEIAAIVSDPSILPELLGIDAAGFFQIVSILFLNRKVVGYIATEEDAEKDPV